MKGQPVLAESCCNLLNVISGLLAASLLVFSLVLRGCPIFSIVTVVQYSLRGP